MRTKRSVAASDAAWRVEWTPFLALLAAFSAGAAFLIAGLAGRSFQAYEVGNLIVGLLEWFIFAWLILYVIVEYVLWRRTRNVGHRLQYLGASLLVLSPLFFWIPLAFGGWSAAFSPAGLIGATLFFVAFVCGCVLALAGYYYPGFRAGEIDLYRNVVVREGERIERLTNAFSDRPFAVHYDGLPPKDAASAVQDWARTMAKAGLLLGHRTTPEGTVVYPVTWTGLGALRWGTALVHLLWLLRSPERLTWARLGFDGNVLVHVSRYDYRRIRRPVAYHLLVGGVADALVSSLLAYAGGDLPGSISSLTGPRAGAPRRAPKVPTASGDLVGRVAAVIVTILVLAGLASAAVAAWTSPERTGLAITNVRWSPANPGPGEHVDLFATLRGADDFFAMIDEFYGVLFVYFNRTDFGLLPMRHVEGSDYGVRIGPFPDGTEATVLLTASIRRLGTDTTAITLTADPIVIQWGQVHRGGPSRISVEGTTHRTNSTNLTVGTWINSSASIDLAQVFVGFSYTEGALNHGAGVTWSNLSALGGRFEASLPLPYPSPLPAGSLATVYYMIVGRDATWNSATSGLIHFEVKT